MTVIPNKHYNETPSNVNLLVMARHFTIKTVAYTYKLWNNSSIRSQFILLSLIWHYWLLLSDWSWIYRGTTFLHFYLSTDLSGIVSEWLFFGFHNFIWKSHQCITFEELLKVSVLHLEGKARKSYTIQKTSTVKSELSWFVLSTLFYPEHTEILWKPQMPL